MRLISDSLLMCPAEDWRAQARWNGSIMDSRQHLLQELTSKQNVVPFHRKCLVLTEQELISPSVMIPEHRLAHLLKQVKQSQINNCLYHNSAMPPSLYSDHMCDRDNFPLRTMLELDNHADEVWYLEFSHDGTKLATASKDRTVLIYETGTFTVLHRFADHDKEVTYITWSPDDSKLISCSMDHKARVWEVSVRTLSVLILEAEVLMRRLDRQLSSDGSSSHTRISRLLGTGRSLLCNIGSRKGVLNMPLEPGAFRLRQNIVRDRTRVPRSRLCHQP